MNLRQAITVLFVALAVLLVVAAVLLGGHAAFSLADPAAANVLKWAGLATLGLLLADLLLLVAVLAWMQVRRRRRPRRDR